MKPHKHAELIKAWADGAEIQFWGGDSWYDEQHFDWHDTEIYRVKPKSIQDVVGFFSVQVKELSNPQSGILIGKTTIQFSNLQLVFDGKTGNLKSAEVLK